MQLRMPEKVRRCQIVKIKGNIFYCDLMGQNGNFHRSKSLSYIEDAEHSSWMGGLEL